MIIGIDRSLVADKSSPVFCFLYSVFSYMTEIFIVAGESSGDMYGANLVKAFKSAAPGVKITALGGSKMKLAGADILADPTQYASVGVTEAAVNLRSIYKIYRKLTAYVEANKPSAVVLIDYPEFNLKFAAFAKRLKIPLIYYITPQIWAWRKGRVKKIARFIDKVIVAFEFEKEFYKQFGIEAEFAGHPLLDIIQPITTEEKFAHPLRKELGIEGDVKLVALLPGSRFGEFKRHLPVLLGATKEIHKSLPSTVFALACAPNIDRKFVNNLSAVSDAQFIPVFYRTYDVMRAADIALVASGTATLETAIFKTPMVVIYKLSFITGLIARVVLHLPHYSLVNIMAGRAVVPELLQGRATPENIAREAVSILASDRWRQMHEELAGIAAKLGTPGASIRAARIILNFIGVK